MWGTNSRLTLKLPSLVVFISMSACCQSIKIAPTSTMQRAILVSKIKINRTLNKDQAELMIDLYSDVIINAHCFPTDIQDEGSIWCSTPNTSDECLPDRDKILVSKKTGAISWGKGPRYSDPQAFGAEVIRILNAHKPPTRP